MGRGTVWRGTGGRENEKKGGEMRGEEWGEKREVQLFDLMIFVVGMVLCI